MSTFSVIHFSTSYSGGAAIAAKSLNEALRSNGVNSHIYFLSGADLNAKELLTLKRSPWEKFISKTYTAISSIISRKVLFTIYSSKLSSLNRLIESFDPNSTVLHFHNWFNIGNLEQFSEIANRGYKLVFTLHDERFYTGGCHYALECEGFTSGCEKCPNLPEILSFAPSGALQRAEKAINDSVFTFIAPSKWIELRALSSRLLRSSSVIHIPNYISDSNSGFRKFPPDLNSSYGSNLLIGVASVNPFDSIKGGELLKEVIEKNTESFFELVFLKDFSDFNLFWRTIDYLLVPSKIDNSPNVIHEAKMNGIPIIAAAVGGITELLGEQDIRLLDDTYESLLDAIKGAQKNSTEEFKGAIMKELETYRHDSIRLHISQYEKMIGG